MLQCVSTTPQVISLNGVHFAYPDGKKVFAGVTLHIKAGETVALVGESG